MFTTTTKPRTLALLLALVLLINTFSLGDGKRLFGGGSSRKSSGSSSSRHSSSTGTRTQSKPSYHASNHENTRLSYSPSHAQAPSYHTNTNTFGGNRVGSPPSSNTHNSAAGTPIGWNVPKAQGPPPSYSAVNPAGGAKTNLHESPPAYRSNTGASSPSMHNAYNPSAPPYPGTHTSQSNTNSRPFTPAQTYPNSNTRPFTPAQTYRPRFNGTGSNFGSNSHHTPLTATNAGHGVQSGSYPRQQVPAGATYYPGGSALPAGATYHPAGSVPHGATYYPSASGVGGVPHGASYYPSSSHIPAGASYHPAGQIPAGAHYYPSAGAAHYPSAPAGATYLPAGAALPAGATYYAQPPKSSSGLGFGSGLAAGALGGALLGHALTPSRTYSQSYNPGYNAAPAQAHEDKVIIINNGPPGSVSTTNAGDGVTVINAGGGQQQQPQPAPMQPSQPLAPYQPMQPAPQPLEPAAAAAVVPAAVANPADQNAAAAGTVAAATPNAVPPPAATAEQQQPPPAGGIICVPVKVPQPDPQDATKTIEVEQIACYPAPPPEANIATAAPSPATTATDASTTTGPPTTTKDGAVLAPFQSTQAPLALSEGSVPLAPLNPSSQPDIMRMPGEPMAQQHTASTAQLAPGSNLHVAANGASKYLFDKFTITSSLLSLALAFCLY